MHFVTGVSLEYLVLCDQALGAFREKHLVAELDRGLHLAALNQIGVGFKDGVDLVGVGNFLSLQNTAARLTEDTIAQLAVVVNPLADLRDDQVVFLILTARFLGLLEYRSRAVYDLLGELDEFAVFLGLLLLPLFGGHALDFLHAAPRRAGAIAESLQPAPHRLIELAD